jgi:hypothetical protein
MLLNDNLLFNIFVLIFLFLIIYITQIKFKKLIIIKPYIYLICSLIILLGLIKKNNIILEPLNNNMNSTKLITFDTFSNDEKNGIVDVTDKLKKIFSNGGNINVPNGKYLISYKGDDKGGVEITNLKKNIIVKCDSEAIFIADNLDNDMIRFWNIASNVNFEWYGGIFYKEKQKTSTVVPISNKFTSKNQGKSATSDSLTIYSKVGTNKCIIDGVTMYGTGSKNDDVNLLHWKDSGGDGGIFVEGMNDLIIRNCKFVAIRDSGIYTSKNTNSTLIENNEIINCFHGIACKRGVSNVIIDNNTVKNCVRGIAIQHIDKFNNAENITIKNNKGNKCNVFIQLQNTNLFTINNNKFEYLGSTFIDGTIIDHPDVAVGIDIDNSSNGKITNNSLNYITNGILKSKFKKSINLFRIINGSRNNVFKNNKYKLS